MTNTSILRKGYRLRPARLAVAVLVVLLAVYLLFLGPRRLTLALSLPAPSVLSIRGALEYAVVGETAYAGRCLALKVSSDGSVWAVTVEPDGGASLIRSTSEGWSETAALALSTPLRAAAFFADGAIALWTHDGGQGAGSLSGLTSLPESLAGVTNLRLGWTRELDARDAALMPTAGGLLIIGAGTDGVPAAVSLFDGRGRVQYHEALEDGIYTAWATAQLTGGFALAGAEYSGSGMTPFIRQYGADGKVIVQHRPADGPPSLVDLSPTGRFLGAVTPKTVTLWQSDGERLWTEPFPGSRATTLRVFADGRILLTSADTALGIDLRGRVYQRWRAPAAGPVAAGGPVDLAVLAVAGGCAVMDAAGIGHGVASWEGPAELVSLDPAGIWMARAGAGQLSVLRLHGPTTP